MIKSTQMSTESPQTLEQLIFAGSDYPELSNPVLVDAITQLLVSGLLPLEPTTTPPALNLAANLLTQVLADENDLDLVLALDAFVEITIDCLYDDISPQSILQAWHTHHRSLLPDTSDPFCTDPAHLTTTEILEAEKGGCLGTYLTFLLIVGTAIHSPSPHNKDIPSLNLLLEYIDIHHTTTPELIHYLLADLTSHPLTPPSRHH